MPAPPVYPGPWAAPWITAGPVPKYSIMSISPHRGHPVTSKSWPSIQKAGQIPRARGTLIRAATRP